jgi:uncharacterized protein (DUF1778 family)
MPTAKPRITITLTDEQHELLSLLANLQKVSMSSIVVDLLETTFPVLERLAGVLKNAAAAPQNVLDQLKFTAEQAESDVSHHRDGVMSQLDLLLAATAAQDQGPPSSNRGVRNDPGPLSKRALSPMKTVAKSRESEK